MSPADIVLKYYPKAKPVKVGKMVHIYSDNQYLGKGKNNRCAWKAASRNIDN